MKKYQIIYADPPWSYWLGGKKNASKHYKCQDIEWIYNLRIDKISDTNCALFLWVTFPMLPEGIRTIKNWGFRYVTCAFVWIKRNKKSASWFWGCGNYTRANAEICLLGIKGTMKRKSKNIHQIIDTISEAHSIKPHETRKRIIELFGDLPRIELFAREEKRDIFGFEKHDGWDVWGNEVESDISL